MRYLSQASSHNCSAARAGKLARRWLPEPLLSAAGFEIADVSFERRLYGAYTCVKSGRAA